MVREDAPEKKGCCQSTLMVMMMKRLPGFSRHTSAEFSILSPELHLPPKDFAEESVIRWREEIQAFALPERAMAFWIRKGSLRWEPTRPAPSSSWELIQDLLFLFCRTRKPSLQKKRSCATWIIWKGLRWRQGEKGFQGKLCLWSEENKQVSSHSFLQANSLSKFSVRVSVSSESVQEEPAEPCQTSRNTRQLLLGSWWALVRHPAERTAPKQKTILTYYLLVWSTL